jgi:hypothetical protein
MEAFEAWCGVRDAADQLVIYVFNGKTWGGPTVVGGVLEDAPSCVSLNLLTALCAARDPGGSLFGAEFKGKKLLEGGSWTILPAEAETILSPIKCTTDGLSPADAFCAWDGGGAAVVRRFIGSASDWAPDAGTIPGMLLGPVGCAPFGSNESTDEMLCYAVGRDGYFYYTQNYVPFLPGQTAGPDDYGNWTPTPYDVHLNQFSCAPAFVAAVSNAMWHDACAITGTDDGSLVAFGLLFQVGYEPPVSVGGDGVPPDQFVGAPSCFTINPAQANGAVMCVARNASNVATSIIGP